MAQRLDSETKRLATAKFRDFSFDISPLVSSGDAIDLSVSAMVTPDLLWDWDGVAAATDTSRTMPAPPAAAHGADDAAEAAQPTSDTPRAAAVVKAAQHGPSAWKML